MILRRQLDELDAACKGGVAMTIGVFDAVHRGHQMLIRRTLAEAAARAVRSLVFTFDRHPLAVLAPAHCPDRLTQPDEKARLIEAQGVDLCFMLEFTPDVAAIEPQAFIRDILVGRCGVRYIVCGENFTFGAGARGDGDMLRRQGSQLGFDVEVCAPVMEGASQASSSRIRAVLIGGEVAEAAALLGRPYGFEARVVKGDGRGRRLGYPTANFELPPDQLAPADGVYAVAVTVGGERHGAMMNIGARPTFAGAGRAVEAHLFDFDGDLTGQAARVDFLQRVRDERKFDGPEELIAQLRRDEVFCGEVWKRHEAAN